VTRAELEWLEYAEWGMRYFDGVRSGRSHRRAVAERLVERGLLRSLGFIPQADGDGFIIETRQPREAWALTDAGREALARSITGIG